MASVRKNFAYNSLLSISRVLFPLISFPYAARVLEPEGIGAVNFIDSYVQYFCIMAALGIPIYGIREVAKMRYDKPSLEKLTSELVVMNFVSTLFWLVIYYLFAFLTGKLQHMPGLHILGSIYLLLFVFPVEWFFQGTENFAYITIRSLLLNVLSIILLFIFVRTREDVLWYYSISVTILTLNSCINMYKLSQEITLRFRGLTFRRHIKPLFFLFSSQIAINIYVLLDKVLLGLLAEDKYVGYYATASKLIKIFLTFIGALAIVMVPKMSRAFKENDHAAARSLFLSSCRFVITIGVPIAFGVALLADDFVNLISGSSFAAAATSIRILAPVIFLIGLNNIFGMQVLTPFGREKLLFVSVSVGTVLSVGLNVLLIPMYKHNGAAWATLSTELLVTLTTGYFALKYLNMKMSWGLIIRTILICLPFYLVYRTIPLKESWARILAIGSICSLYYAVAQIWIFKDPLWNGQYYRIWGMIKKIT